MAISYEKLGDIYATTVDFKKALENYQERNRISLEIYQSSPENLNYKSNLGASCSKLGTFYLKQNEISDALNNFFQGRTLFAELWEATQGEIVKFTFSFALNTKYVTDILKMMIQSDFMKEDEISQITEQAKTMRREGYIALQPLAEAGALQKGQLETLQELAGETWYKF